MPFYQVRPPKRQRSKQLLKLMQRETRAADALVFAVCAFLMGFSQPPFLVCWVSPSSFPLMYLCDIFFPQHPEQSGAAEEVEMPQLQVVPGKRLSRTSVRMCDPHLHPAGQWDAQFLPAAPQSFLLPQKHRHCLPWASQKGRVNFVLALNTACSQCDVLQGCGDPWGSLLTQDIL